MPLPVCKSLVEETLWGAVIAVCTSLTRPVDACSARVLHGRHESDLRRQLQADRTVRRLLIPILALALGGVGSTPASTITFGEPDGALHPNVGVVVTDRSEGSPGPDITCSGTLIAERVFVTVAHCIDVVEGAGEPLSVSFDSAYDEEAASPSGLFAGSAIKHPMWGPTGRADPHDMAVIPLDNSRASPPRRCQRPGYSTCWRRVTN